MAVNVSAKQLQRPEFIDEVADVLKETAIVPSSLTLELTESVMMQDMEVSLLRLEALRGLGVKLAIDDFGTGYSSLNYVRELPVDILKIDRSFLADTNPQVEQMTASIVELARIFNLKAVAEGVENPDQLAAPAGHALRVRPGLPLRPAARGRGDTRAGDRRPRRPCGQSRARRSGEAGRGERRAVAGVRSPSLSGATRGRRRPLED